MTPNDPNMVLLEVVAKRLGYAATKPVRSGSPILKTSCKR